MFIQLIDKNTKVQEFKIDELLPLIQESLEAEDSNNELHINLNKPSNIENNGPTIQRLSKDFDINIYYNKDLCLYHFLINKTLKVKVSEKLSLFELKLLDLSFFMKNEEKSLLKFNFEVLKIETIGLKSKDWTIVRLNQYYKKVLVVLNKSLNSEVFFNSKYKEKLRKCENFMLKNIGKIIDALWISDFIVVLTGDFRIMALNKRDETVFFIEEFDRMSNFIRINEINSKKTQENRCFLMKNEKDDCLVVYLEKNVFIYKIELEDIMENKEDIRENKDDFLKNCLFNNDYHEIFKPLMRKTLTKLKKIDVSRLNCFKLFANLKKTRDLIECEYREIYMNKLKRIMCEKIIDHLRMIGANIKFKFLGGSLDLMKFYPFISEKKEVFKRDFNFVDRNYLFFAISLAFLLFPALKEGKKNDFQEKLSDFQQEIKEQISFRVLELIEHGNFLQILGFFHEKSLILSQNPQIIKDYGLAVTFLVIFLKERLLFPNFPIKFFTRLFLNDLLAYIRNFSNNKTPNFLEIEAYMRKNSFTIIKLEENQTNKVNLLNLFIYLVDFLNIHQIYLSFLRIYFKKWKIEPKKSFNLLMTVLKIVLRRNLFDIAHELFQEICELEKRLEFEIQGNIDNECSMSLTAIILLRKSTNYQKNLEFLLDFYKKKMKVALKFMKKQKNENFFLLEVWKKSLLGFFMNIKEEKTEGNIQEFSIFIRYLRKTIENIMILMGVLLMEVNEKVVFFDKTRKNIDLSIKNNKFIMNFNKLLNFVYYFYLKIRLHNTKSFNNHEKVLISLRILRRFQKFEYKPYNFSIFLDDFLKEENDQLFAAKNSKEIFLFYSQELKEIFIKSKNFQLFSSKFLENVDFQVGEQWDYENYRVFSESFLDFLRKSHLETRDFQDIKSRLLQHEEILMQLYEKYSRIFLYSPEKKNFLLFFDKNI